MEYNPLISVVIPTYNRAHLIAETLDSILAQTYQNWECIIVDDGSTDTTKALVEKYVQSDGRYKYLSRPSNLPKGPSSCRNYGFENCKGEYIQWFDSDDLMHPQKLELKLEMALKNTADVIIDKHLEKDLPMVIDDFTSDCFSSHHFYIDYLLGKHPVITNDVMLKRSIIGRERFDENLWKGEEFEFFGRVFHQQLIYCFMDIPLTHYRISADSISISPKQASSLIYLSKKMLLLYANNTLIVEKAERQGRKTYKNLAKRRDLNMILKNFNFFRKLHHKSVGIFFIFMVYNLLTSKGFDRIKPTQ